MSFPQIKRYAFVPNKWIAPKYERFDSSPPDRILSKFGTLTGVPDGNPSSVPKSGMGR